MLLGELDLGIIRFSSLAPVDIIRLFLPERPERDHVFMPITYVLWNWKKIVSMKNCNLAFIMNQLKKKNFSLGAV